MKLRSGAVDYGRIYEQKTAALFSIRCALDPSVADFWIVSNVSSFGDFDDIIFFVENIDGTKGVYCVQLKHSENEKPVIATQLEGDKGNFALSKYYKSYKSIKKNMKKIDILNGINMEEIYFILYTNVPLVAQGNLVTLKLTNTESFEFLRTSSKDGTTFQVSNAADAKNPYEDSFLQNLFLYCDQASAGSLDRLIKNEFDAHFEYVSNTVIITITDYFLKWAIGKKSKIKRIFKKDIQMKLLESLLQPHVIEPKGYKVAREFHILRLLNDTITSFNVTPIKTKESLENIFASVSHILQEACDIPLNFNHSWNTSLTEKQHDILKKKDKEKKQEINIVLKQKHPFVAHLSVRDLYLSAWQCKLIPLVVDCELSQNIVQKIILKFKDVTKHLSFVLLQSTNLNDLNEHLKIFNNFNDIDDAILIDRNLKNTYVSLQGKNSINLKELKTSVEVLKEVTPDIYMVLLSGALRIGETYVIENYYIKRSLQRSRLSFDVLDEANVSKDMPDNYDGNIFVIVEFHGEYIPRQYKTHSMDLLAYLTDLLSNRHHDEKYIFTIDAVSTAEDFRQIISSVQTLTKKAIHVIKVRGNSLEWLFSNGPIDIIHDYLQDTTIGLEDDTESFIPEDGMLQHFQSQINIISNNAGMGKTFMLNSLANKFDPTKWICLINLSEHMPKVSQIKDKNFDAYINYVRQSQIGKNDEMVQHFCLRIFEDCWKSHNVVLLLDGYDEVSSEETLAFIKEFQHLPNVKVWITTRPTCKRDLEVQTDSLSLQITHFMEEDYVMFLWKYFETYHDIYGYNEQQIQYIINTINKCSTGLDKTFVSIPLQTRMFAQIFGDDINQITEKERLTIVDLYNKFVNIKLKDYKSYEATSLKKTLSKLALKLFFTEDQLDELLDFEELAEEALTFQESYRKDSLVIGLNEKGDAVFGHRTFAEFLAAHWLAKQIVTNKGRYNVNWLPLIEKLFYVDMISVRVFFDRILCQDLPLHLAVLNSDMDNVELLLNDETSKSDLDKLGRSALHLAVSYGKYFDLYLSTGVKGLRAVGKHTVIQDVEAGYRLQIPIINTQLQIPKEIVEKLLDRGCVNSSDVLFNYDAFDFAMKSCSLEALDCLFKKLDKDSLLFEPEFNFKAFIYCIVYDNLHNILSNRKLYSFDKILPVKHEIRKMFAGYNSRLLRMQYNEFYLTEIAAYNGGRETLFELLHTDKLHIEDGSPVHRACFNGHTDVVDLLYKFGADIQKNDTFGWNPIHQAGKRGRSDITYDFLRNSAHLKAMTGKVTSMSPIHYASQGGHLECIKKLVELGATYINEDAFRNTALYYASLYGHIDVVEFMINNLSSDERNDKKVHSVLNVVASKGYSIEKLIKCGLNVNNFDDDGNTPLILASKNGFPNVIEELVRSQNCDLNLMKPNESISSVLKWAQLHHIDFSVKLFYLGPGRNKSDCGGLTALHFATLEGRVDCVTTLVNLGADKHMEDTIGIGYSPLIWAAIKGSDDIVAALLISKLDQKMFQIELEDAEIALIWASILGFDACVFILLAYLAGRDCSGTPRNHERIERLIKGEYGSYYNKVARPFGDVKNVPLVVAAINNRVSVIRLLVSQKYKHNQTDLNVALFFASMMGHLECVKALIELGADEHAKTERMLKVLPIVWASMNNRSELLKLFLHNKPKEYARNSDVAIALNFAATNGLTDCAKVLLDFGFDVNNIYEDLSGGTPLLNACEYYGRNEKIINELLSRNCDVNAKNNEGLTALDYLAKHNKFDLVKILLSKGAHRGEKVDTKSDLYTDLQAALEWATIEKETEMIDTLLELGISRKTK